MEGYKVFKISKGGVVTTLYSDDLRRLAKGRAMKITRASNVEPNERGLWDVVLTDDALNGEYKGHVVARDVASREEAIRLEVDFINKHILGKGLCHV